MLIALSLHCCVSLFGDREGVPRSLQVQIAITDATGVCASAQSWRACYPMHNVRCYTDADVSEAVQGTRWAEVWPSLRPVERADVWRYLHVWRHGGIYADADAFCVRPLPMLPLTVGIEATPRDRLEAERVHIVYPVQYVQWVFAAEAPRHPALAAVLNDIYASWARGDTSNTLQFTGPAAFTRSIASFVQHPLPQVAFACNGYGGPPCSAEGVYVRHEFRGSWK